MEGQNRTGDLVWVEQEVNWEFEAVVFSRRAIQDGCFILLLKRSRIVPKAIVFPQPSNQYLLASIQIAGRL